VNVRYLEVLERDVQQPIPAITVDPGLEYRVCGRDDLEAFRDLRPHWRRWRPVLEGRLARGATCVGAFDGDRGVGFVWLTDCLEVDRALGLRVRPEPDQVYGFDLFVAPDYRRRRVGPRLMREWLMFTHGCGRRTALGVVQTTNRPMMLLSKAGFGFVSTVRLTSVQAGLRFGFITSRTRV
jgi:GNAT superfamily N-acetyltransferase